MSDKSFFDEQTEQSLVKAKIVNNYLLPWSKIIMKALKKRDRPGYKCKLAYLDLFAGPGRYKDGSKSTPRLVLETAIKSKDLQERLITIFNDSDIKKTKFLSQYIQNIPGISFLKNSPIITNYEVSENTIDKILNEIGTSL